MERLLEGKEMSIIENISARSSVRTYSNQKFDSSLLLAKIAKVNNKVGPFGNQIKVHLVNSEQDSRDLKLGTYGVIKGANSYLIATCDSNSKCLLDLGYLFEEIILYATSLGLGTVWMAGTFSRKQFKNAIDTSEKRLMPIVAPVGYPSKNKSFVNKYIVKSKTHVRKSFEQLFTTPTNQILNFDESNPFHIGLEMVRLSPSALNKQPWRVVVDGNNYHFYSEVGSEKADIDLGIALYHFDQTMKELGYSGVITNAPNSYRNNYVSTWSLK